MKRTFTRFMAAILCLTASLTASAQFTATIEMYPRSDYEPKGHDFSLSEVAQAVGTDAATLAAALDSWMDDENPTEFLFQTSTLVPTSLDDYTADSRGFWMSLDGTVVVYGEPAEAPLQAMYNRYSWDAEAGTFTVSIGQMPGKLAAGDEGHANLVLAYGGKKTTFAITLKVVERPEIVVPTPTTTISKLNVVAEKTAVVHQYARNNYDADDVTVDLTGIAALLGTEESALADEVAFKQVLFSTEKVTTEGAEDLGLLSPELTNTSTAGGEPGWWFSYLLDKNEEFAADFFDNGYFYAEGFSFDENTKLLSFRVGQKGGKMPLKISDDLDPISDVKAHVYIVWGDKAFHLTINLIIDEREALPFDQMTEVGSENVVKEMYPDNSYSTVPFSLDIDAIAALLETDVTDLFLWAASSDGGATDGSTGERGGYWFDKNGAVCGWGSGASICLNPNTEGNYSAFTICQYPNSQQGGDTAIATLYIVGGSKYYTVHVTLNVLTKEAPTAEFVSVATRAVNIQAVPSSEYLIDMRFNINSSELESLIGTASPALYARLAPEEGAAWDGKYTDDYSCTPYPGFWMSSDGFGSTYGSSPWGFTYSESDMTFTFYSMPGMNSAGNVYTAPVYLVNETTGAMITYNITLRFVNEVNPDDEIVGEEELWLPVLPTENREVSIDFGACLKALDLENVNQLLNVRSLVVLTSTGNFSDPLFASEGAQFNPQGALADDNENDGRVGITFEEEDATHMLAVVEPWQNEWNEGERIVTQLGFSANAKRYIFKVTFVDEATYTAIRETKVATPDARTFDLSGRPVAVPVRHGIYIQNGRKTVK